MITFQFLCFTSVILLTDCSIRFIRIENDTHILIREHSRSFLVCRVKGDTEDFDYQWAKRTENNTLNVIPNSNNKKLTFAVVEQTDSGNYICQAKLPDATEWVTSKDSRVDVVTRRDVTSVEIYNSSRVEIRLHQTNAILYCHARGRHVSYRWSKVLFWGRLLEVAQEARVIFNNFTKPFAGIYVCQARSENQNYWVNSTHIEVVWTPDKTSRVKILNDSYVAITEGSPSKYLTCQANGYLVEYQWSKIDFWNNEQIIPNSNNSNFYIRKVNRIHEDRYLCRARSYSQQNWVKTDPVYVKIITNRPLVRVVNGSLVLIPEGTSKSFLQCESDEEVLDYRWIKVKWDNPSAPIESCNNSNRCDFPEFEQKFAGKYACQVKIIDENNEHWLSSSFSDVRVLYFFNSAQNQGFSVVLSLTAMIIAIWIK